MCKGISTSFPLSNKLYESDVLGIVSDPIPENPSESNIILMKKILFVLTAITLFSCSADKMELPKAKANVEGLLQKIDSEQFSEVADYYAADFNAGEPEEARAAKFRKLKSAMGGITKMELVNSKSEANIGEESKITLTYKVTRTKIISLETFVLLQEEGDYKVAAHSITTE